MGFLSKITGRITGAIQLAEGNDDLVGTGVAGTAAILDVTPTGRSIGLTSADGYSKDSEREIFRVHARITRPGRPPYEVTHDTTQDPSAGSEVECFVDPGDDQRIHYQLGSGMEQTLAATDASTTAALSTSLGRMLGRPVGTDPSEVAAAMQEVAMLDDATKQRNWERGDPATG